MYHEKIVKQCLIAVVTVILLALALQYSIRKENAEAVLAEETAEAESWFEDISLCGYADSFQRIRLFKGDEGYVVFMPSEMRTDVYVQFEAFKELQIGEVVYSSGAPLTDIYKDSAYPMTATGWDGTTEESTVRFYFSVGIPSLYIESLSGSMQAVDTEKGVKESAQFAAVSELGTADASGQCTIKARGNTSFRTEQKSYSLNLSSGQSVLGMPEGSEWTLLANYRNSTQQMRNKIALDMAKTLGMDYTPQSRYVNLYINNQYNGLYLMTQKVSSDGGAVQINEPEKGSNLTGAYLLEFDSRYEEEPVWFKTETQNVVIKSPKNAADEAKDYISSYLLEVEETVFSPDGENAAAGKSYQDYIDLDSWTAMYLMQEFFVQWDVEFASFYLYKLVDDPYIYAGPVWDFDLAYGEMFPGYYPTLTERTLWLQDNRGGWLGELGSYPEFQRLLKEKYQQVFSPALEQYLEQEFDELVSSLASSSYMNSKRWNRGDVDIKTDAEQMRSWIENRKYFLDQYAEDDGQFQKVTFSFGWGPMSYYVQPGEKLGFLPCEEYGEVDYLADKDYGYGTIVGWKDEEGNEISANTVIEEDAVFYPVYLEQ